MLCWHGRRCRQGPPAVKGSRHVSKQKQRDDSKQKQRDDSKQKQRDDSKQKQRAEGKRTPRNASERPEGGSVFAGRLITVRLQPVTHPDGSVSLYEVVAHPDAVAIVAVRSASNAPDAAGDGEPLVALVRQPRPAIGKDTWEDPTGVVMGKREDLGAGRAMSKIRGESRCGCDTWNFL